MKRASSSSATGAVAAEFKDKLSVLGFLGANSGYVAKGLRIISFALPKGICNIIAVVVAAFISRRRGLHFLLSRCFSLRVH